MPDREKVIEGLRHCLAGTCAECPYDGDDICGTLLKAQALTLLEEQEPVTPGIGGNQYVDGCWWYICPKCRFSIDKGDRFCRHCGRKVEWD